jgi:DNA-binding response OmpR family regulator
MGATRRDVYWSDVSPDLETILLVEDEFIIRLEIHHLLSQAGYQVLEAGSSSEALRLAEQYSGAVDLLLTDIGLPDLIGPELAKILTRWYPKLKTVYMSGYPSNMLVQDGVLDEGTELLSKPLQFEVLLHKVRAVLDNNNAPQN